ncbi:RagB/SusD family nutrient uptake outer membrane protein [Chitinophaga pinensis]|uniref:RagB/SusD family nutrient uptake outer membrane protein n=1 Tax=Chitinophaga pinensis TaxID=79329 RepID=A0A5C6LPC8_9BACT|nr:RagB/SusD family nutrient uptake outer membrane protein [Chitinophaga pinensis]TWV96838.1 RagB/SusD family nutrient uptake outer membrane protein [Chitinophaga pinensis]
MYKYLFFLFMYLFLQACTKKLDLKPDESRLIPETLEDLQALLDNTDANNNNIPAYTEAGADNYYITDVRFNSLSTNGQRNAYIWGNEIFTATDLTLDWGGYTRINYSNLVLETLTGINTTPGTKAYNNVKGSALFLRALSFYTMAELFTKPYDSSGASSDPGLPLRTTADAQQVFPRASLRATYEMILMIWRRPLSYCLIHPCINPALSCGRLCFIEQNLSWPG